jgi:hypothetical protein
MNRLHPALILLIVAILAYGLLIPQLGFYWDDLPMSWVRYQLGAEAMTKYFSTNRPVWGLLYQVTTHILPQIPIYWQLLAFTFRWLGAVAVWGIVREVFPQREKLALSLSLLFLLYPGFNQQWGSYLYSHFFIVLFFFLFSFYLMLRRRMVAALILSAFNLWMMEYFFVLELARPFVIWISLRDESITLVNRFKRTLSLWTPYLAVFALAVLSRLFIFNNQIYQFNIREEFAKAPLQTTNFLLQNIFTSLWTVTGAAWGQAFQFPGFSTDGPRTIALYALIVLVVGALILFVWRKPRNIDQKSKMEIAGKQDQVEKRSDAWWLIGLGAVMLLLAGPPFWLTDVPISLAFPANRASLSFMLGVSFLLIGLIDLIPSRIKYVIVIVLVALAAGRQFLWSNEFRRDWNAHKNLFWQMIWRAPGIEKNTMVLMNEELEFYADNSLSAALNWIYAPDNHTERVDYVLFYPTNRIEHSLPELKPDVPIHYSFLAGEFDGNTSQALAFYYAPPGCLRLLDPEIDPINRLIPDESLLRDAASLSSTVQILDDEQSSRIPKVYSPEPAHGWCYYFEKADLARQLKDWDQVAELGNQAFALDDYPNDPVERFVFIEGYAHTGEWDKARELSLTSYQVSKDYVGPLLCGLWDRIEGDMEIGIEEKSNIKEMRTEIGCLP